MNIFAQSRYSTLCQEDDYRPTDSHPLTSEVQYRPPVHRCLRIQAPTYLSHWLQSEVAGSPRHLLSVSRHQCWWLIRASSVVAPYLLHAGSYVQSGIHYPTICTIQLLGTWRLQGARVWRQRGGHRFLQWIRGPGDKSPLRGPGAELR